MCVLACLAASVTSNSVTLWALAPQASPSMGVFRKENWSGLLCPPPGDLPRPGIKPASLKSPALAGGFFTTRATWEAPVRPMEKCKLLFVHGRNIQGMEHAEPCPSSHPEESLWMDEKRTRQSSRVFSVFLSPGPTASHSSHAVSSLFLLRGEDHMEKETSEIHRLAEPLNREGRRFKATSSAQLSSLE